MSTRTRIVLYYCDRIFTTGSGAVRAIVDKANPQVPAKGKLKKMVGLSKREKLVALAQLLPPMFSLILIQEPRGTRKNRSLYWQLQQKERE